MDKRSKKMEEKSKEVQEKGKEMESKIDEMEERKSEERETKSKEMKTKSEEVGTKFEESQSEENLEDLFDVFSIFGDRRNEDKNISLRNVDKWFTQAKLFNENLTNADTAIEFSKIARNKKKLNREEFHEFLRTLAEQKNLNVEELEEKLAAAGTPSASGTTKPIRGSVAADNMDRLTDPSQYTGTHRERFDAEGKGKGLSGRYESADDDGYVQGYKRESAPQTKDQPPKM